MHCYFDFHFAKSLEKFILESNWLQDRTEINFYIAIKHLPSFTSQLSGWQHFRNNFKTRQSTDKRQTS